MDHLFAVYLGGTCGRASIEVHDVVFVVAADIKSSFPKLRRKWFGDADHAHVDSWIQLDHVDGFEIQLVKKTDAVRTRGPKLYFVNAGFYRPELFGEQHEFFFTVGNSLADVKKRVKAQLEERKMIHIDNLAAIDDLLEVKEVDGYQLNLRPGNPAVPLKVHSVFWRI